MGSLFGYILFAALMIGAAVIVIRIGYVVWSLLAAAKAAFDWAAEHLRHDERTRDYQRLP